MNELGEPIVSELDRHLGQLHEPITPHAMAQRIEGKRPDLVEHLTDALGSADEGIEAVVIGALDRPPQRTTRNLTPTQRRLLRIMRECQFGRVENLRVAAGQLLFESSTRIVRVARIGGEQSALKTFAADEFELKQAVCDLFDELAQLRDGMVLRLEFRHGLPWLLETEAVLATRSESGN